MPNFTWCFVLLCPLLLLYDRSDAQRMFFNTTDSVYEINGSPGNYTLKNWGHLGLSYDHQLESLAMHGDTLYVLLASLDLYRVLLSSMSTSFVANIATPNTPTLPYNAMCCDKNGILYAMFSANLIRYDPRTNLLSSLGTVNEPTAGDLVFYGDTLLSATIYGDIEAIDINQPSNSYRWMATPKTAFYGLLVMPDNCEKDRLFGLDANDPVSMTELDPITRTVTGLVGQFPYGIFDAASTAEVGGVIGVRFDSLALLAPCGNSTTGGLQAFPSSALDGNTTFTLDGAATNSTGIFSGVPTGPHSIRIQTSPGCTVDSSFTLHQGLTTPALQAIDPQDCAHADGSITVTASSQSLPILYSIDTTALQSAPVFSKLTAGTYTLIIKDAGHCEVDTSVTLSFQHILPFPGTISTAPALCRQTNGSITVMPNTGVDPATLSAALNEGAFHPSLSFPGLPAATDTLHVTTTDGCRYDSVITIVNTLDAEPAIQAQITPQRCFVPNGSIGLSVAGNDGPYTGSINAGAWSSGLQYDSLAPGTYTVSIRDNNTCQWDTAFVIQPYPKDPVTLAMDSVNPICSRLNSGSLTIRVDGDQAPYWLGLGNTNYTSGSIIPGLSDNEYTLPVVNRDGCVVDSAYASLTLEITPECSTIYLPNAFTPNGDGVNDAFHILRGSPYLPGVSLKVFNRYGGMVFSGSNLETGWNGTYRGERMPAGTYVWEVEYTDLENKVRRMHGTVLLVR